MEAVRKTVYINSLDDDDFVTYTRKNTVGTSRIALKLIREVKSSEIPITEKFKNKVLRYLSSRKPAGEKAKEEQEEIIDYFENEATFDETYYEDIPVDKSTQNLIKKIGEKKGKVSGVVEEEELSPRLDAILEEAKDKLMLGDDEVEALKKYSIEQIRTIIDEELARVSSNVSGLVASDEEDDPEDEFGGLQDDLVEEMTKKGYTQEERDKILTLVKGSQRPLIREVLDQIQETGEILKFDENLNVVNTPVGAVPVVAGAAPVPAAGVVETKKEPEVLEVFGTGSDSEKLPFLKRYHTNSIKIFFNNSSYPQWDRILETNILSLDITTEERIEIMEDIIEEYGKKVFIKSRKGSSIEELNELVQLQFSVMRNLNLGTRSSTANVKLSDLSRLQSMANASTNTSTNTSTQPAQNDPNPPRPIISNIIQPLSEGSVSSSNVQTFDEARFIEQYDKLQNAKNLSSGIPVSYPNRPKKHFPTEDPHTIHFVNRHRNYKLKF